MKYYAHLKKGTDGTIIYQTASEHCHNTAEYARHCLEDSDLGDIAYLSGLLHDMGKFKAEFQRYLLEGEGNKGSVIHTFAGAKYMLDTWRKAHNQDGKGDDAADITAEVIAYAIAAHHGLFDLVSPGSNENGFLYRKQKTGIRYEESRDGFLNVCATEKELAEAMQRATTQIGNLIEKIFSMPSDPSDEEVAFHMSLAERMVLSAVVDGDRSDTAAFMGGRQRKLENWVPWDRYLSGVEAKLNALPCSSDIDRVRHEISDCCRKSAEKPGGIYQLKVPTGGGKTLASLRYALAHAAEYGKKRLIFTAPLLTILEQNAKILRYYIGDDAIILEHHSDVIRDTEDSENAEFFAAAAENWEAPVIITTMVQLLNTMFSGKMTSIRRFHSLANSVIVIDEVQTVPLKMLSLFNLTVMFLANICGATVVLCSATQPCLKCVEHPLYSAPEDLIPYNAGQWKVFKRTELIDAGSMQLKDIPAFAGEILEKTDSLLIICNKKSEAEAIFVALNQDKINCFCLSAALCREHRRVVLENIYCSLASSEKKTVCVATQVIEAGVDISFGAVIRLSAGLDHIIQSAGRCNRNAESNNPAPVYIVTVSDENLSMLQEIKGGKDAVLSLLEQFKIDGEMFRKDLASDQSVEFYYQQLYTVLSKGDTEYPVRDDTLFEMLSLNSKNRDNNCGFYFQQAFKTAGENFRALDSNTVEAVVPYGDGIDLITELYAPSYGDNFEQFRQLLNRAKPYTVSIYDGQRRKLEEAGGLHWLCDGRIAVVDAEYYNNNTGLTTERQFSEYLEV